MAPTSLAAYSWSRLSLSVKSRRLLSSASPRRYIPEAGYNYYSYPSHYHCGIPSISLGEPHRREVGFVYCKMPIGVL